MIWLLSAFPDFFFLRHCNARVFLATALLIFLLLSFKPTPPFKSQGLYIRGSLCVHPFSLLFTGSFCRPPITSSQKLSAHLLSPSLRPQRGEVCSPGLSRVFRGWPNHCPVHRPTPDLQSRVWNIIDTLNEWVDKDSEHWINWNVNFTHLNNNIYLKE